jgi:hypothetical protein
MRNSTVPRRPIHMLPIFPEARLYGRWTQPDKVTDNL